MGEAVAVRRAVVVGIVLAMLPLGLAAQQAAGPAAADDGVWSLIKSWGIGAATVSLLTWIGAKLYEQIAANIEKRRAFAGETAKRVVEMSWKHYWGLANAAGTLAGGLREYLRDVEAHLFVSYARPGAADPGAPERLRNRMRLLAADYADKSFPHLVRLIMLFHEFQFRGSNNYLLPDEASADALRRLYNRFVSNLPGDPFLATIRREVERFLVAEKKTASEGPPLGLSGAFLEDREQWKALGLDAPAGQWRQWFERALPQVEEASEALETYADLITHELALLNHAFFRDRRDGLAGALAPDGEDRVRACEAVAADWADRRWPGLLTERSLLAIARSDHQPRALLPLGGAARARKPEALPVKEEQAPAVVVPAGDARGKGPSALPARETA